MDKNERTRLHKQILEPALRSVRTHAVSAALMKVKRESLLFPVVNTLSGFVILDQ